jgi:hypothetical protein
MNINHRDIQVGARASKVARRVIGYNLRINIKEVIAVRLTAPLIDDDRPFSHLGSRVNISKHPRSATY